MWTKDNRARYDRSGLRYPSDLTDEEWALVAPLISPAKRGGGKRSVDLRAVVDGLMYVSSTGCQWRAVPKDLPPRSTVHGYLIFGTTMGRLGGFITPCACSVGSRRVGRPVQRRASSIARASKARKRGLCDRPVRLRRRQDDQWSDAARPCRHTRPADARPRASSRHPGPGWRRIGHGHPVWPLASGPITVAWTAWV